MKSITIAPRNQKEFYVAFNLLTEFGKERKRLSLDDDDDISFAFLMKESENTKEDAGNVFVKKSKR